MRNNVQTFVAPVTDKRLWYDDNANNGNQVRVNSSICHGDRAMMEYANGERSTFDGMHRI